MHNVDFADIADMAEMVDAYDSGSYEVIRTGSSPAIRTNIWSCYSGLPNS